MSLTWEKSQSTRMANPVHLSIKIEWRYFQIKKQFATHRTTPKQLLKHVLRDKAKQSQKKGLICKNNTCKQSLKKKEKL